MNVGGHVYMVTNKPRGVLYTGVTSNLPRRIYEHREGLIKGFTKRYNLKRLVWYEEYPTIDEAVAREKAVKQWLRAWKIEAIEAMNPDWNDLYELLNA